MSKIGEFVTLAKTSSGALHLEINFGTLPNYQAQLINQSTGIRANSATKTMSLEAIRHTFKRHGNDVEETKRGQKGVVESDFELIPDILSRPDEVRNGGKNSRGQDSLVFIKKLNSYTYHVVMAVRTKKEENEISLSTMYIKR